MRKQILFGIVVILAMIGITGLSARAEGTWTDPETGLMWSGQDNGAKVNWTQAKNFCANLQLGGFSNWRLPTLSELKSIYDKRIKDWNHIKGQIHISPRPQLYWTSSAGDDSSEKVTFEFMLAMEVSENINKNSDEDLEIRVLCVRRP